MLSITSCVGIPDTYEGLPPGEWRGVLKLADDPTNRIIEQSKNYRGYTELPYNFMVTNSQDSLSVTFINGDEKITISDITVGLDRATAKDTILIEFKAYDTYFKGIIDENIMEGLWYVNYKEGYSIPFIAYHGQNHRFITHNPVSKDFGGRWDVTFNYDNPDDAYKAIGIFKQEGNILTGTFQTEAGDYRFLEGNAIGDKMKLSVFDGSHAFYFEAKQINDGELTGIFKSGKHYNTNWSAKRSDQVTLEDPFNLTSITSNTVDWNDLQFNNSEGELRTIVNTSSNAVKLINIMGTWCPNCMDEINYLKELKLQFPNLDIASVCYERYKTDEKNLEAITRYKESMQIPWPIYLGGYASKTESSEDFSFLSEIISYPTLIILDRKNNIRKIHTGFNGPATAEYQNYVSEMNTLINQLLDE